MGSVFKTIPGKTIKGFGGAEYPVPMYLQFVPGYCSDVIHSKESLRYGGEHTLNTIIAVPHITDKAYKTKNTSGEQFRYYPLLRGITDVPSKGDPVLLCTIGKINYFLGPLNTNNNSPTWNDDPSYIGEVNVTDSNTGKTSLRGKRGESNNFNKEVLYSRLNKIRKEELDYGSSVFEVTGDTLLEGRHGNSIRIGSRSNNPYVFISNERTPTNPFESLSDGSLISITSNGTLQQHFGNVNLENGNISYGFTLASDTLEEPNRFMGTLVSQINNNQETQQLIYDYSGNQTLINSDRITLNSKLDDIYVSSIKDIHIGTGRHLTISANEDLVINSQRIILGNPEVESEPMILGTTLLELLKETLAVLKSSQGICQGAPIPLADETGAPGGVNAKISQIEQKIDTILSNRYFIEPNI
tara:strand:+ start:160 stop:1401 length:1242 start_codon:yes stop_codon:yes gene_type:complete